MPSRLLTLVALTTLLTSPTLARNEDLADWNNLSRLAPRQRIEVIDRNLKRTRGTFVAATSGELQLQLPTGVTSIPRAQVFRVSLRENSKRLRNSLIGLAVGAAAGLAIGAAVDRSFSEDDEHIAKMLFVPIGLGAGTGVGAALPAFETIYRAPKR